MNKNEIILFKFYRKNYPELFKKFLSKTKGYNLAKKELGHDHIKSKKKLSAIFGINSKYKKIYAKIYAIVYDFYFGSGLREGYDVSNRKLNKYLKAVKLKN